MNKTNVAIALLDNVSAVTVKFLPSGGNYTYLAHDSLALEVGDKVVVDTPKSGLVVTEVIATNVDWDIDAAYTFKFIVQRVDTSHYDALIETVIEIRKEIERSRKDQARQQVREMLNLKVDALTRISDLNKKL
ncbi:hypothetical protein [Dickeya phage Amaethon]|nr:hypothetical protein [Dickeya phage Amaethon]